VREPWFPASLPRLAIFYGEMDTLVKGAPLVERIRDFEPHVDLRIAKALPTYEHQDFLWGCNAVDDVYLDIIRCAEPFAASCALYSLTPLTRCAGCSR